jgi:hypothetical protein
MSLDTPAGRQHRRAGYKSQGMDVLFLTTTGRKSGQPHATARCR